MVLSGQMLPLLVIMCLISTGQGAVGPIISLRVKELDPAGQAATISGLIFSLIGLMAALSSFVSGRLGERVSLATIMAFSSMVIGVLYLPPVWVGSVGLLAFFLGIGGLFRGALYTSSNAMVGVSVAATQQGVAYGLAQSASALGFGAGPLLGGTLGHAAGLSIVFAVSSGIYVIAGVLTAFWLLPRKPKEAQSHM